MAYLSAFKSYLEIKGYQKSTVESILKIVEEYIDYTNLSKPTDQYLRYLSQRKQKQNVLKTLENSTLNHHIFGLKLYFNYLESFENKKIAVKLLNFKKELKPIKVLSTKEIDILFNSTKNVREKTILTCLYHLGLRVSELANLTIEDVDFKENIVFIAKSKTGQQRKVPINKSAKEHLKNYCLERKEGPLFLGLKGPLSTAGISQVFNKIVKRTTIQKRVYPHLLRHSIATQLLKNGMPFEQVSQFLGHRSLASTERYTHIYYDKER